MLRVLLTWPIHISTDLLISVLFSGATVYSNHRTFVSLSWYSELAPHSLMKPFNYFPRYIFLFIKTDILYILCFLLSLFFSQHYSSLSLIEAKERKKNRNTHTQTKQKPYNVLLLNKSRVIHLILNSRCHGSKSVYFKIFFHFSLQILEKITGFKMESKLLLAISDL